MCKGFSFCSTLETNYQLLSTPMLILYSKDNCQYCEKVKSAFATHKITYEERNIKNPEFLKEVQGYQARTMPFLVDTTANVHMGESDEIIAYALEGSF